MLPTPGPSPQTSAARRARHDAFLAAARMRVLQRHAVTEADIEAMTDAEREASTLGGEIMFEIAHSDFAKEHRETEDRQRAEEDKSDVEQRVQIVRAANATAPFPYSPKQIRFLLRRRTKAVEDYSYNMYFKDLFGLPSGDYWQPNVNRQAIAKSLVAAAPHKEALRMVGEAERLTKIDRRRKRARLILNLPRYFLWGMLAIAALLCISLAGDIISYLHRAPTVVAVEKALVALWKWLPTYAGMATVVVVLLAVAVVLKVRKHLNGIAGDKG